MSQARVIDKEMLLEQMDVPPNLMEPHRARIYAEVKSLGGDSYDMHLPEIYQLPYLVHLEEHIQGIVFGRYQRRGGYGQLRSASVRGRGVLLITDRRILFLDKKPLFMLCDEIPTDLISGITYTKAGVAGTVTLQTKTGDYAVRTFNQHCATNFVSAVEASRFYNQTNTQE